MASVFHNPAGIRIAVVDQRPSQRQALCDALRKEGAGQTTSFPDLKALLSFAETDCVDWVITGIRPDDGVNALQLLNLCIELPQLKNMRVSLFVNEADMELLPLAFELGAVSWHNGSLPGKFVDEFKEFFRTVRECGANEQLIATRYLRRVLKDKKYDPKHLVSLARNLLEMHPGSTDILLNLAEAQLLGGLNDAAALSLGQIKLIDPSRASQVADLQRQHLGDEAGDDSHDFCDGSDPSSPTTSSPDSASPSSATPPSAAANALGVSSCLVVDPDSTMHYAISQMLKGAGVQNVECFARGDDAWEWIKSGHRPDLILQEWRLPGVNGTQFLQRLRQKGLANVPVIVISSLVGDDDHPLLSEMGVSALVEKPFDPGSFFAQVIHALQQNRLPTEQVTLERRIRQFLGAGQVAEAKRIAELYFKEPSFEDYSRMAVAGEFAYAEGDFLKAKSLAVQSLRKGKDTLELLNLLAKSLMKLGEFDAAFKCYERADAPAPQNVERLCKMSMAQLECGNTADAEKHLSAAKSVDAGSQAVVETETSIALATNDVARASACMAQVESFARILGFMNNKAVTLVRHNKFEDGIGLYRCAVKSLPGEWSAVHDTVCYNLALAFVRYSNLEDALEELNLIRALETTPLGKKVASLKKRVADALKNGTALVLQEKGSAPTSASTSASTSTPAPNLTLVPGPGAKDGKNTESKIPSPSATTKEAEPDYREFISGLAAGRGDICLYRIFVAGDLLVPRGVKLVSTRPDFRFRNAVCKKEDLRVKPGAA